MDAKEIYEHVQERYGSAAKSNGGEYARKIAAAFGYSEEELLDIPVDANLGLSCGNPLALAKLNQVSTTSYEPKHLDLQTHITQGETVIDLGSGAGFDVFLAAKKVGATGKVYGVDMNKVSVEASLPL